MRDWAPLKKLGVLPPLKGCCEKKKLISLESCTIRLSRELSMFYFNFRLERGKKRSFTTTSSSSEEVVVVVVEDP